MQARALPVQPCYDVVVFLLLQPNAVSDVWDVCAGAQDAIEAQRFLQAPGGEARQRRLRDALHVAADVAEALRFLHSLDVVHGRLTPSARRAWSQPPLGAAAVLDTDGGVAGAHAHARRASEQPPGVACSCQCMAASHQYSPFRLAGKGCAPAALPLQSVCAGWVAASFSVRCWQRRTRRLRPTLAASLAERWAWRLMPCRVRRADNVLLAEDAEAACGCRAKLTGYGLAHAKPLDVSESPNAARGADIAHWSPERLIDAANTKVQG